MKANGVTYYKEGNVVISFTELTPEPVKAPQKVKKTKKQDETDQIPITEDISAKMPNDGDLLFYSTESFDSLIESRKDDTPRN